MIQDAGGPCIQINQILEKTEPNCSSFDAASCTARERLATPTGSLHRTQTVKHGQLVFSTDTPLAQPGAISDLIFVR